MSGSSHLAAFIPRRFDELVAILHGHGFDIASNTHPAFSNEWQDAPPLGLVRIKGVWLPRAAVDADAEEDERVTFSVMERWAEDQTDYAHIEREGLWLAGYGYNGYIAGAPASDGRRNHRHDFDPTKDAAKVHHLHPLGQRNDVREPEDLVTPEWALGDLLEVLECEIAAGRFALRS